MLLLAVALMCEGRYPLPPSLLGGAAIVIGPGRGFAIEGVCQPVRGKKLRVHGFTRIRARWRPCAGVGQRVRLGGTIVDHCDAMKAVLTVGPGRGTGFGATREAPLTPSE